MGDCKRLEVLGFCEIIQLDGTLSIILDLMRVIAAFLVLLGHTRSLLLVDYENVDAPNLLAKGIYFISGYGSQAVVLFFVLSGFLIGNSVLRAFKSHNFSWTKYLYDRLTRLWIVLLPALLLGGLLDIIGASLHDSPLSLYWETNGSNIGLDQRPFQDFITIKLFLGNLLFLQSIWTKTFGSNGPLWSLSHEFWYYMFLPAFLASILTKGKSRYLNIIILSGIILTAKLYTDIGLIVWSMGVVTNLVPSPKFLKFSRWLSSVSIIATTATLLFVFLMARFQVDFLEGGENLLIGLAVSCLIWSIKDSKYRIYLGIIKLIREFSRFSYSLYVCHMPFMIFLCAYIAFPDRYQPDAQGLFLLGCCLIVVTLYAYVFANLTEYKTSLVRERIKAFWSKP